MNDRNVHAPVTGIASALLVSNDAVAIEQLSQSMQQLALTQELCSDIPMTLVMLNRRKFDAVIVDLQLGGTVNTMLERVRRSPSNRTAVLFTVTGSDAETASAFRAGSNFVLRRPLSLTSVSKTLKVAYGLILRERRRYFRCPIEVPATIFRGALPNVYGHTLNISENGMAITTSAALRPGLEVQVHFELPECEFPFALGAAICWCKEGRVGLKFDSLSAHAGMELQEWLLRKLEEDLPEALADRFRSTTNSPHATEASAK